MTGNVVSPTDVVTKTSNAILVLPTSHSLIQKKLTKVKIDMKRAMAACCQCRMCTDLCSRNLLGHPIEPHAFMRTATTGVTKDVGPFINTMYCSQCGICELYACGQNLSPRTLIGEYKAGLRKSGIKIDPADIKFDKVSESREHRIVPISRLTARLGLTKYNVPAPLVDETIKVKKVKIMLSQNIGVPATAIVSKGDTVTAGQVIAEAAEGKLSMPVHASINGKVTQVNDKFIVIEA
jgi:Na+-translocating ferredoxin:NAD+ oxidoreductase RnfC subunit